ncbi:hypothetical protein BV898_09341 [Hypsibius exemplaris]|uniref:Uncharacterized protein n=1 Tax=Hypsibius exemplaris TaxID=2072580 RepID=A0A1W0WN01_HYPEX|nr:hypothetical protein BV898_09341 [Hypsibius exemplaris]
MAAVSLSKNAVALALLFTLLQLVQPILPAISGGDHEDSLFKALNFQQSRSAATLGWKCIGRMIASRHVFLEIFLFIMVMKLSSWKGFLLTPSNRRNSMSSRATAEDEDLVFEGKIHYTLA